MGYSTLYGDMAGAFAPIGGLYKTDVFALARWRNRRAAEAGQALPIPVNVFVKPPSAELAPGQSDEASLGVGYDVLDAILVDAFERGLDAAALPATTPPRWSAFWPAPPPAPTSARWSRPSPRRRSTGSPRFAPRAPHPPCVARGLPRQRLRLRPPLAYGARPSAPLPWGHDEPPHTRQAPDAHRLALRPGHSRRRLLLRMA